jgi:hypothetical protein
MVYGLEVFAANGTKVIEASSRVTRSFGEGTTSSITHGSYVDVSVTGMTSSDDWQVFSTPNSAPNSTAARSHDTQRFSGYFRISNNMGVTSTFDYIVIRSG